MPGLVLLGLLALVIMFVGGVSGLFAAARTRSLADEILALKLKLRELERKLRRGEAPDAEPGAVSKPPKSDEPLPDALLPPFAVKPPVSLRPEEPAPSAEPPVVGGERLTPLPPASAPAPKPVAPAPKRDSEWWANFEERVGKRWMTWAGALVVILGVGFFVKYAIDQAWLNEVARDSIGIGFGALLVCLGARFASKKMTALGQGLMGCGLGILYMSVYTAYGYHAWMPQWIACGALVLVSAAGISLSVVFDALPVSVIAILGGFLTPLMVSTGRDERDLLFAYLLLLDVSVLGVAFFKRWRPLDIVAFLGTAALFVMWLGRYYPHEFDPAYMWATMSWLGSFFLVFLVLPFAHHMRTKTPITVERFVMALVNATGVCTLAYFIMYRHYPHALGYAVLGMSAAYLVLGVLCRRLVPDDEKSLFGFLAIAVVFFTISIPLHFGLNGVTLCWVAEAPLLLYLGYKYNYRPVKLGGFAMLIVLLGRFFLRHWPMHDVQDGGFVWFANPSFAIAMAVVLSGAAYALVHQWQRKDSLPEDRQLKENVGVASGVLALIFINCEVAQYYRFSFGPGELAALPGYFSGVARAALWALGAVVFLVCGLRARWPVAKTAAFIGLVIAVVSAAGLYALNAPAGAEALLNLRFTSAFIAVAALFACGAAFTLFGGQNSEIGRRAATVMHVIGGFALLILFAAEDFTFVHGDVRILSITTAVWALGAAAFMAAGIWWRSLPARVSGRVALTVSILSGILLHFERGGNWPLFLTTHFAAMMAPVIVAFAYPLVLFLKKSVGPDGQRARVSGLFSRAALLLLVLLTAEFFAFSGGSGVRSSAALLWAAGAAALFAGRFRWAALPAGVAGVAALGVSIFYALASYAMGTPAGYTMFFNLRFGACVLGVVLLLAAAARGRRRASGDKLVPAIATAGVVLLLLLLSVEPYTHCVRTMANQTRAAWSAQMSLSVVWSAYAAALLAAGFWLKNRPMRFGALALFGATGLKLVLVDLAGVRQVYRIISFLVLGLLMIGASYLYHKVEKRLAGQNEAP